MGSASSVLGPEWQARKVPSSGRARERFLIHLYASNEYKGQPLRELLGPELKLLDQVSRLEQGYRYFRGCGERLYHLSCKCGGCVHGQGLKSLHGVSGFLVIAYVDYLPLNRASAHSG
jgi:hypothetical protein